METKTRQHRSLLQKIARRVMLERGLLPDFSSEALAELDSLQGPAAKAEGSMRDLRHLLWCSIDNDDSRDLDHVTMASLPLSAPLLYLFLNATGGTALVFFFLFGFTIMASFSVTLVMIQETMSKHVGMASGLMIGFALGVGGIGVLITGHIADVFGIHAALNFLVVLPIIAGILTAFVPSVRRQATE